ncbi:FG-GAP-like repeat-containing protein [Octadecabacter sp.]|nr:FG-GAP-like repeat-containing protein [Octadecabacter sp.]
MSNKTIYGTDQNDFIDASYENGTSWGDRVDAGAGDDTVILGPGVTFFSGPGDDQVIAPELLYGTYGGALNAGNSSKLSIYDLANGRVKDPYGGLDTVSGITEIHILNANGDEVYGSGLDEVVFISRGDAKLFMGDGEDSIRVWEQNSTEFEIETGGASTFLFRNGETIEIRDAERIEFSDLTLSGDYRSNYETLEPKFVYQTHSWLETEFSKGWWYAEVYNEPQLVPYFPQAVVPVDIGNDGDLDLVIPMNRGYRTGVDTRFNFQVLENIDGELIFSEEKTSETPFVAGSRRTELIYLEHYDTDAIVTIAHDTAIETETRYDIPWRLGDLTVTLLDPFVSIAETMLQDILLPNAERTGRPTSLDAHSMAIGDLNRDGLDDVLVGEFSGTYGLIQTLDGKFEYYSESLPNLSHWYEPDFDVEQASLLLDLHMEDLNGDGFDDIVAGWGHNPSKSRIFFNSENGFSEVKSTTLPTPVYGVETIMHMNTWSEDFDGDGDQDLIINQTRFQPYYSGTYLQYLVNDGVGNFIDVTSEKLIDPDQYADTYGERLEWTDMFSVFDVDNDGDLDIAGRYVDSSPIIFLNNGSGAFELIELPRHSDKPIPLSWGDFDQDGKLEFVQFHQTWLDAEGTSSELSFNVYELGSADLGIRNEVSIGGRIATTNLNAIPNVSVNGVNTSVNGVWNLIALKSNDLTLEITKEFDDAGCITSFDALQALRLAVGLTKSDGTAEWHDYLAADINKDGRVGADDALDILKFAVGLTDGSSADWIFVDGDADWSGIDRRNTDYNEGVMIEDVLVDTSINMTGILVGDLDGSYVA